MLRCSFCRERYQGRPASAYLAFFPSAGTRRAFKVKAGPECVAEFRDFLHPFLASPLLGEVDIDSCRGCGIGLVSNSVFISYLTLYLPRQESQLFEAMHCEKCFAEYFDLAKTFGEELPDRETPLPAARASVPVWDALGLNPTVAA
jgi:hypothetical protein